MAPKGMKDRQLYLQCEWGTCKTVIEDTIDEFIKHIKEHMQEFLQSSVNESTPELPVEYECLWRDCGFSCSGAAADLIRHVFFHAYHTKVKWYGLQEQTKCKLNPCQLDMQNRNLIPELPELFQCAWHQCMYHVDNPEYFYRHVEMHAMTSDSSFIPEDCMDGFTCKWEGCRTSVKNKFKLREHLRSHTQEKRYGCYVCGGLFYNRTKFVDHLDRQLAVELQKFQCSHCSKTFSTERLLRDHMRCHVNHYKCPFCDMTCPSPSSLKAHIKFRHTEEKPHKCELCGYGCKSSYDLRRHMDSHNATIVFKCEEKGCQYTTKVTQSLRLHYKKVHNQDTGPRYLCHICHSHFSRGGILTKHLKTKHKFKWPSGHCRFRYKLHEDGFHRLQTVRYESIELTEQLIKERQGVGGARTDHSTIAETEGAMEVDQEEEDVILPSGSGQQLVLPNNGEGSGQQLVLPSNGEGSGQQLVLPSNGESSGQQLVLPNNGDSSGQHLVLPSNGEGSGQNLVLPNNGESSEQQLVLPNSREQHMGDCQSVIQDGNQIGDNNGSNLGEQGVISCQTVVSGSTQHISINASDPQRQHITINRTKHITINTTEHISLSPSEHIAIDASDDRSETLQHHSVHVMSTQDYADDAQRHVSMDHQEHRESHYQHSTIDICHSVLTDSHCHDDHSVLTDSHRHEDHSVLTDSHRHDDHSVLTDSHHHDDLNHVGNSIQQNLHHSTLGDERGAFDSRHPNSMHAGEQQMIGECQTVLANHSLTLDTALTLPDGIGGGQNEQTINLSNAVSLQPI